MRMHVHAHACTHMHTHAHIAHAASPRDLCPGAGESEACERVPQLVNQGHMGDLDEADGPEAAPRKKGTPAIEASNLLFYSTIIASGHGRGIVIGTGDNTVMGQVRPEPSWRCPPGGACLD